MITENLWATRIIAKQWQYCLSWASPHNPTEWVNLLMPNVNYSGRTEPLTSKVAFYIFIQQIQVLNILNTIYTLRFFLFKMQFVS